VKKVSHVHGSELAVFWEGIHNGMRLVQVPLPTKC
jgi:hypothetical protein